MTFIILNLCLNLYGSKAYGWGRQGHSLIGETAARVIAEKMNFGLLQERAYDVGYYSNVPDFVWKKSPEIYKIERPNHYIHLDTLRTRIPTQKDLMSALQLSRLAFNTKFTDIDFLHGRAFWRIRELEEELTTTALKLKNLGSKTENIETKHQLQYKWLLLVGVISHYVGDLSQPLHTTENFDGQKNNQQGIHAFYEDTVVDYLTPELRTEVLKLTRAAWPSFHKKNQGLTTLELLYKLTLDSLKEVQTILDQDKKIGRANIKKAANVYHKQIASQMTRSALVLAELISRHLDWSFNNTQFYLFNGEPNYISYPGL